MWKTRIVVECHKDVLEPALVHDTLAAQQFLTRTVIAIVSIMGFYLFFIDVSQAYMQISQPLKKDTFVKPCREIGRDSNKFLKLKRPLQGLAECRDSWARTLKTNLMDEPGIKSCTLDPTVSFKLNKTNLL